MRRKEPAVISIFAALSWCLAASVLFVLLDGVRVAAMGSFLDDRVHLACRNTMAAYEKELYEEYGLLGIDEEYSHLEKGAENVVETMLVQQLEYEKELEEREREKHGLFSTPVDLFSYPSIDITNGTYQVLSDGAGEVFLRQAASYMTALLPEGTAEKILGEFGEQKSFQEENNVGRIYDMARDALETAASLLRQSAEEGEDCDTGFLEENGVVEAARHRQDPVLELVLQGQKISSACLNSAHCPSKRTLLHGTMPVSSVTSQEKILGICYFDRMFSDYLSAEGIADGETAGLSDTATVSVLSGSELGYQQEYLIVGKSSDRENLSGVCSRILAFREAVQFANYYADPVQTARAYTEAVALVGFTGNPVLIKAVQLGFLAAWSFEDAVRDVRKLLAGQKVSLSGRGTTDFIGYGDYLRFLLFLTPAQDMAMRGLDVVENHVNAKLQKGDFYVDHTITAIEGRAEVRLPWLFSNLVVVPVKAVPNCKKTIAFKEDYF